MEVEEGKRFPQGQRIFKEPKCNLEINSSAKPDEIYSIKISPVAKRKYRHLEISFPYFKMTKH